jgi:hypothetical protein
LIVKDCESFYYSWYHQFGIQFEIKLILKFLILIYSLAYCESVLEKCKYIVWLPGEFDNPILSHDVRELFPEKSTYSENNKDLCANTCFEYVKT